MNDKIIFFAKALDRIAATIPGRRQRRHFQRAVVCIHNPKDFSQ